MPDEQLSQRLRSEPHGVTASLRRRLGSFGETGASDGDRPSGGVEELGERYLVRESTDTEPLHVADGFLDAADAAFQLIEERNPERLEIVRASGGELEQMWSYRREDASASAGPASDTAA